LVFRYRGKFEDQLYQALSNQRDELQTAMSAEQQRRRKAEQELFNLREQVDTLRKGKGGIL
jgi:uncharacterized coiled-coil DUF342 family protein